MRKLGAWGLAASFVVGLGVAVSRAAEDDNAGSSSKASAWTPTWQWKPPPASRAFTHSPTKRRLTPTAAAASCLAAFEVLEEEPQLIQRLWDNTNFFKEGLKRLGFDTGMSETPITPVIVGDTALAHQFSRDLFEAGVFAQSIGFPTVPKGKARIRTIVTATHTRDELSRALHILETGAKKLRII